MKFVKQFCSCMDLIAAIRVEEGLVEIGIRKGKVSAKDQKDYQNINKIVKFLLQG